MNVNRLLMAVAAWTAMAVASASAQVQVQVKPVQVNVVPLGAAQPPVQKEAVKEAAMTTDPAEPPLSVDVSYGNSPAEARMRVLGGARAARVAPAAPGRAAAGNQAVKVATSAKGTELTLNTPGSWQGTANLTFKSGAPPMRFTMKLARMPAYDLQSLSITSGAVTMQVGNVGTKETTRYFDAKGQALERSTGAAYTVVAKRAQNGEVTIDLKRSAGGALAKALSLSWTADLNRGGLGGLGGFGAAGGGIIIKD